jgi:hypothetical protein
VEDTIILVGARLIAITANKVAVVVFINNVYSQATGVIRVSSFFNAASI